MNSYEYRADEIEEKIIQLLRKERRPLTTEYICSELSIPKIVASSALYKLLKNGLIRRIYTDSYDPTRPFDTASWTIDEKEAIAEKIHEPKAYASAYTKLVLSVPLSMLSLRLGLLNKYDALDLHDAYTHVIEIAKNELKIMCPIIDAYALYPLVTKMINSKDLKIRILTELEKSRDVLYLLESLKVRNIEIKDVARSVRYENYERKAFGIHAKLVIADDEVALIGTFNLSRHHYLVNFDLGFLLYDANIIAKLSSIFDELWNYVSIND